MSLDLRHDRNRSSEGEEVMYWGKLFQIRAAATGKARSRTVDSRVRLMIGEARLTSSPVIVYFVYRLNKNW